MKRNHFTLTMVLALLITSLAFTAHAGPIITVTPDAAGPIACGDFQTFTVTYNPIDYTGELGQFVIGIANGAGNFAIFDDSNSSGDFAVADWPSIFLTDGVGEYEVMASGALIGADPPPVDTPVDLFTVMFHGDGTGLGELNITSIELRKPTGQLIAADSVPGLFATLDVDCTPPDAPVLDAEPDYTAGEENTVSWGAVPGAVMYNVRSSNGQEFQTSNLFYTFEGLVHNTTYCYDVQAIDGVGNIGPFSDQECSTQDTVMPESTAGPLDPAYGSWTITIPVVATDDMSGVQFVQLYFQVNGGGFLPYGTTFLAPSIEFIATEDGEYEFYTLATDNAGNPETNPIEDSVVTILDTTEPDPPIMCAEDPFTPGDTNEVCWEASVGATEYRVFCSNGENSGWITDLTWIFDNLDDGITYLYQAQARDGLLNTSLPGATVQSTQDASPPVSGISAPPSGNMPSQVFNIDYTAVDATSGVLESRLFYQRDGGLYVEFGTGFIASPIAFTAPGDGIYNFYISSEDLVGNIELAPLTPHLADLNVDTGGPIGTFVINNDDTYTTTPNVLLNFVMDDPSGVEFMDFSFDGGTTWTGNLPYDPAPYAGVLIGADGDITVLGRFTDFTGLFSDYSDIINLDTTPPEHVSVTNATAAVRGHEMVTLNWTEDDVDGDLAKVEIWVALWDGLNNAVGTSAYPTFRGKSPTTTPVPPTVETLGLDADYVQLAIVDAGVMTYVHTEPSPWARSGFSYHFFAMDNAGNYSGPQSNQPRRGINYLLGDFDEDGIIDIIHDVTLFASVYGAEKDVDAYYDAIYDISPVIGGMPMNDDFINHEDLFTLAQSYGVANAGKAASGDSETPVLTWFQEDELNWVLGLVDPCNSVKGLRLASALPENVTIEYSLGAQLEGNSGYFLANDVDRGLDLGFAVLGTNMVLAGSGEILRVTTSEAVDLSKVALMVRDAKNEDVTFDLTAEPLVVLPTAYKLHNNYPNPFNPETNIKFALPEAQNVKLEIFDIKGYRVQVLLNESMEAGNHSVMWNGRDKSGRMVASGTYFYRIQAGPLNQTNRMLLIK